MSIQTIGDSMDFAQRRSERHARYPKNADGRSYCEKHGCVIPDDAWTCTACSEELEEQRRVEGMRKQRINYVEAWWARACNGVDGLGGLPFWSWARFGDADWERRCDRRVVDELRGWHPGTESITVFSGTGTGKTSGYVARLNLLNERALAQAEIGPLKGHLPDALYIAGYNLAEANKRRRLGQEHHALIEKAIERKILILDEVHPSHSPADLVFTILDERTRAGRFTALGSGMSAAEFGQAYGAAALRRVIDGGKFIDTFAEDEK